MQILFLLPDILDVPTGGNVYNASIIEHLKQRHQVTSHVLREGEAFPEVDSSISRQIVVDSLIADRISPNVLRDHFGDSSKWVLLVHYLPQCDPTHKVFDIELPDAIHGYNAFITTSQFSKSCLMSYGIAGDRISVVYPGLDRSYLDEPKPNREVKGFCRMLTVSSLLPGKGLTGLLDILERLPNSNWCWDIVGSDQLDENFASEFKELTEQARTNGKKITWKGVVPASEMPALYQSYDLYLSPSRFETLGMAIREAMASRVPVLSYDVGGVSESTAKGGGRLVPAFETGAFCAQLEELIESGEQRKALADAAWLASRTFPTWEISADAFGEALRRFS